MLLLLPLVALLWLVGWSLYWADGKKSSAAPARQMDDPILIAIIDEEDAVISASQN
jgi:hypothetical protein